MFLEELLKERKTAALLDWLGEKYIYSTRTEVGYDVGGEQVHGDLTCERMTKLCVNKHIKLIIDAAHPFALNVHNNIKQVACKLVLPVIRFNRVFQDFSNEQRVKYFDDYEQLIEAIMQNGNYSKILALTGVQTIVHF